MKQYRRTLLLFLVFASLAGCYIYLQQAKPFAKTTKVFTLPAGTIQSITVTSAHGRLDFRKQNSNWVMIDPGNYQIDQNRLFLLENTITNLNALQNITENAGNLNDFGLDKPALAINIGFKGQPARTLLIGDVTETESEYYAMESGESRVFTLFKSDVDNFRGTSSDFRDHHLLTINPGALHSVTLESNREKFQLQKQRKGDWRFTQPVGARVKGQALKELLEMIAELKIKDFIEEDGKHEFKYLLNPPSYILTLKDQAGNIQTICFGGTTEDDQSIYAKTGGMDEIFTVAADGFNPADFKMGDLFDEAPLSIGIGEVEQITIHDGNQKIVFEREPSKRGDTFTINGKSINQADFNTLYINMMALSSEGYDPEKQRKAPELTITFELKRNQK
ncbi:MAG TPA: DUF4340 domain-containing protein, partial [Bacillota bacterium]|nr:DUF4340 domain-containing protein [Bacillota bacterium]